MDYKIEHLFPCTADRFWSLMDEPEFVAASDRESDQTRQLLEDKPVPGGHDVRVRFIPNRTMPAAMASALGADRLSFVQEQKWRDKVMTFRVIPDVAADRFQGSGKLEVLPRGPNECLRRVTGTIRISVPLVGGRMEAKIVEDLEASYERVAALTRRWLAR